MVTTAEQKRASPAIEELKSQCSSNGKKLLESADSFAQLSKHDLGVQDIATTLFWNTTMLEALQEVHVNPQQACKTFIESISSARNKYKPTGSIQDIFDVAREESLKAGSSKIRVGDIAMAIYNSPTRAGRALKEALESGLEKGVSFQTELRSVINTIEKPWAA
ncbi:MAG: hypothetical protein AAB662_02960 [Patescibacteria group bacterium]